MPRGLKFRIEIVEELYYPCSENIGAVTAQLICVFFFAYAKSGFLMTRLFCKQKTLELGHKNEISFSLYCDIYSGYCANSLNLSNLIANYHVNFMYLVTNPFDKYLNRIGNSIAYIER